MAFVSAQLRVCDDVTEDDKARKIQLVRMVLLHEKIENMTNGFRVHSRYFMKWTVCLDNILLLIGNGNYAS